MSECKPVAISVELGAKLIKKERQSNEEVKLPYRELLGILTYLNTTTRPDISFAVSHLGQFNCYGEEHWTAVKRVLLEGNRGPGTGLRARLCAPDRVRRRVSFFNHKMCHS
jgi:hypothetical protein